MSTREAVARRAAPRTQPKRPALVARDVALALVVPVLGIAAWQWASDAGVLNPLLFPSPSRIVEAGIALARTGILWTHVSATVTLALAGLVCGALAGVFLGTLNGLSRRSDEVLGPSLLILQTIPGLALIPLIVLLFGGGYGTKVLLVSLAVFFPVYLNTLQGVRGTDQRLVEVGRILEYSDAQIATRILIPHALPMIFVGIRQSLKLAWVGVVGVEMFVAASAGITYMMFTARSQGQPAVVYLGLFLYAVLGVLSDRAFALIERRALRWNRTEGER